MPTPYTKEQIAQANNINLIDYAAMNGYKLENGGNKSLHAKNSGGLYLFKDIRLPNVKRSSGSMSSKGSSVMNGLFFARLTVPHISR